MLAVEKAVVRGEHDQSVCELAVRVQRVDHGLHALVHGEERLERASVAALRVRDLESRS